MQLLMAVVDKGDSEFLRMDSKDKEHWVSHRPATETDETIYDMAAMLDADAENANAHSFCDVHVSLATVLIDMQGVIAATKLMRELCNYRGLHGLARAGERWTFESGFKPVKKYPSKCFGCFKQTMFPAILPTYRVCKAYQGRLVYFDVTQVPVIKCSSCSELGFGVISEDRIEEVFNELVKNKQFDIPEENSILSREAK